MVFIMFLIVLFRLVELNIIIGDLLLSFNESFLLFFVVNLRNIFFIYIGYYKISYKE